MTPGDNLAMKLGSLTPEQIEQLLEQEEREAEAKLRRIRQLREAQRAAAAERESRPDLSLFAWQQEALSSWRDAKRIGVVEAVTGTGKTRVGLAALRDAQELGMRSVVYVPTIALQDQWVAQIHEHLPGIMVSTRRDPHGDWDVTVITIQSAFRQSMLRKGEKALLLADECHTYGAPKYSEGLRPEDYPIRLGLTATLERGDVGDERLAKFFERTCFSLDFSRAVREELIAPFKIAWVRVPFTSRELAAYEELTDNMSDARSKLRGAVPMEPFGDFIRAVTQLAQDREDRRSGNARWFLKSFADRTRLMSASAQKQLVIRELTPVIAASNGTLVFTQTVEIASTIASLLSDRGASSTAVCADTDAEDRSEAFRLLGNGEVKALAAPRILDEGVDLPEVDLGIVVSSTRQRRQMIQRLGRVLRKKASGGIARFAVLVLADSVEDPRTRQMEPSLLDELRPLAVEAAEFDLREDSGLKHVVEFLSPEMDARNVPSFAAATSDGDAQEIVRACNARPSDHPADGQPGDRDYGQPAPVVADKLGTLRFRDSEEIDFPTTSRIVGARPDAVKDYLSIIGRFPLLEAEDEWRLTEQIRAGEAAQKQLDESTPATRAELHALCRAIRQGQRARDTFITSNLRLVVSIAKRRYSHLRHMKFLDVVQAGNLGLIHALKLFDHNRGTKFSTYATHWIRQACDRAAGDQDREIRIPIHALDSARAIELAIREVAGASVTASPPTDEEVAKVADMSLEKVRQLRPVIAPLADVDAFRLELTYTDDEQFGERIESESTHTVLHRVMSMVLPVREQEVLRMRFGMGTELAEPLTLEEVGNHLGVTRERARQLQRRALETLHAAPEIRALMGISPFEPTEAKAMVASDPRADADTSGFFSPAKLRRQYANERRAAARASKTSPVKRSVRKLPREDKTTEQVPVPPVPSVSPVPPVPPVPPVLPAPTSPPTVNGQAAPPEVASPKTTNPKASLPQTIRVWDSRRGRFADAAPTPASAAKMATHPAPADVASVPSDAETSAGASVAVNGQRPLREQLRHQLKWGTPAKDE
ncbi:sigma-70 family RNA polymerase sigma factor [Gulosibacter sediminis]|uniref:sigma-70 family RNA polymerase sigma factor n=1 Tax=Gulosibacter sediminis TaxID=1729695 RepID=UPI0024A92A7A|nr:sigma-70 family RNA polymerase sigma factor [Gulosibacter sediminis]